MIIIGVTGTLGAGKGMVVERLKAKGFKHYSARVFISEEIVRRGLPVNRDTMTEVGNNLRAKHGPAYVFESLITKAKKMAGKAIIESLRTVGEVNALKAAGGYLIAVDADPKIRYERVILRGSETDKISFDKFMADEERESQSNDPGVQNLRKVMAMADAAIVNDGTEEDLYKKVDAILESVKRKSVE
jgi:dephospho-CoA kinase